LSSRQPCRILSNGREATAVAKEVACKARFDPNAARWKGNAMNSIVYIVGAIVIIAAVLSFFGLR
jgi:hypothetical protein